MRIALVVASLVALVGCAGPTVAFEVTVPAETPADAVVVVTGDDPALEDGLSLARTAADHFSGSARLAGEKTITFGLSLRNPEAGELSRGWAGPPLHTFAATEEGPNVVEKVVAHWALPVDPANPHVTLVITPPANTGSAVYVTGDAAAFGSWEPPGTAAELRPDGKFGLRVQLPANSTAEVKVTRGTWSTMERAEGGAEVAHHAIGVGTAAVEIPITVALWLPQGKQPAVLTGNVETLASIPSTVTGIVSRPAVVYLPPGYADIGNTTRYPVLYMHDGQNLMDGATSFVGEWHVDEVAEQLIRVGQLAPLIVVGVYNTGSRIAEYTPVPEGTYPCCKADAYGQYLMVDVKPFIDARYRTDPAASVTGLAGSSLGGLVSTYLGFNHPDVFTRIGAVSPSVWWGDRDLVARASALPAKLPLRIWEDMGTQEDGSGAALADARALRDALTAKGWVLGDDLQYLEAEGAGHNEPAWGARLDRILRYLYPPQ